MTAPGAKTWYLFSVNPSTPPALEIDSGQELTVEVRGAFADVRDIRQVPTPFSRPGDRARVLDGRGQTLLPGFIDMHSHLVSDLGARLYLRSGVITVRFAGNDPDAVLALRDRATPPCRSGDAVTGRRSR